MAAELVGGAVLSASFQVLFDKIASPEVVDYLKGTKHSSDFDRLLKKLKIMLYSVMAVLDDAEQKQIRNQAVKNWVDELQDAVYDAEDILGEIEYDALQLKVEAESTESSTWISKVSNFSYSIFNSTDCERKTKMEEILDRLEYIAKQKDVLGLKEGSAIWEQSSWKLPSTSLVDKSEVYGRDEDKDVVMKLVMLDDVGSKEIGVIPIVGMGGVGKTTLAQAVFDDEKVKELFETKVWICVSEEFDVCKLTKTILEVVTSQACEVSDLNSLQVRLKESLMGKKFLIVLDDVWNENYTNWNDTRMPFKDGAQGSKIMVTTRSEKVASIMGTVPIHHLKELTGEACWQLFAKHAFGGGDFSAHPDLERIGREIVKKCKGLPLAAKTLGGLLRSTIDVGEWERISNCDIWNLTDEQSNILPALRLSYHYLPSHLKRCFAFCSIFPKDYKFQKEELVHLWMAENLLEPPMGNKRMEEVGKEYFNDLLSRSFFQRCNTESCFVMHDLMVDLAKFVSGKYYFFLEEGNLNETVLMKQTHHLAYDINCHGAHEIFKSVSEITRLRTFLPLKLNNTLTVPWFLKEGVHDFLLKLRCLRYLSLSGYRDIKQLPDSIGELRHLRCLDLSYTCINVLPETVSKLYNLQVLKLLYCYFLTELPKDFHRLINLRYLDIKGSKVKEMPTQISKLKNLQMLSNFSVGKDSEAKIGELGELSYLSGALSINNLQNVQAKDALEARLSNKKHLEKLELEWADHQTDDSRYERDVLDSLLPNTTLKKLVIEKYGGTTFPNWLGDQKFCNLVDLSFRCCKHCIILPPLGQLPFLKSLWIYEFDAILTIGPEFYGSSSSRVKPFASLEYLGFAMMSNWKEWSMPVEDSEAFQKLRRLDLYYCKRLIGNLPHFLPSLTELRIDYCPQLASSLPRMPVLSLLAFCSCENLDSLLASKGSCEGLTSLSTLVIIECPNFTLFLNGGVPCPILTRLRIQNCDKLKLLPEQLHKLLPSLQYLEIQDCPELESFPRSGLPFSLCVLGIRNCNKLIASRMNWTLQSLPNLKRFSIGECRYEDIESFPEEGLLPIAITHLYISELACLKTLGNKGLQELTSLENLYIDSCPELQTMSENWLPTSLLSLRIYNCPLLEKKCQRENGEYWNKIAHIPHIEVNWKVV